MRSVHASPVLVGETSSSSLMPISLNDAGGGFSEAWLQNLIHDHPGILPVNEIEPGFGELIAVAKEVSTKHGPIDNLMVTPEGNIVLIEVKLWRNPEARRKVVAQALDYASCLFEMGYEEFERTILATDFGPLPKPKRLHDLIAHKDGALEEAAFIDAVTTNLRRGRALILVVGDGIRTETERLASLLQSHAGAHFTFALIELALFRHGDETLVLPRTLARTEMILRGIITIDDRRIQVLATQDPAQGPVAASPAPSTKPAASITEEQFYEAMGKLGSDVPGHLKNFIAGLEPLGVYPEFRGALSFKWDPPEGRTINLGYLDRNGQLWSEPVNSNAVPQEIAQSYNEELASALKADVNCNAANGHSYIQRSGRAPRIADIADSLPHAIPVIARFIERMKENIAKASN